MTSENYRWRPAPTAEVSRLATNKLAKGRHEQDNVAYPEEICLRVQSQPSGAQRGEQQIAAAAPGQRRANGEDHRRARLGRP